MRDLVTQYLLGKRGSTAGELLKDKDRHPKTLTARLGLITLRLIWYAVSLLASLLNTYLEDYIIKA